MRFARSLISNHPLANILFATVIVLGVLAYLRMPREQDPEINFNWININTVLPGASAEDVEEKVTNPLEDALRNVQDVRWVISSSRESASNIIVRFHDMPEREIAATLRIPAGSVKSGLSRALDHLREVLQ